MIYVFIAQIVIGLLIYGRGWWHMAFDSGTEEQPNTRQLFTVIRNREINVSAVGNMALGLGLIVSGIIGLVL